MNYFRFDFVLTRRILAIAFFLTGRLAADFAALGALLECFRATCAAERRAIGTRKGEQET